MQKAVVGRCRLVKVHSVRAVSRYRLELSFDDGTSGEVDLSHLAGRGVFSAWESPGAFEDVTVGSGGEVCWACGVDLCADALYLRLTSKKPEDLFPNITSESRVA